MNKIFFVLLFIFCSACSVGPDYKRNEFFSNDEIIKELKISDNNQKNVPDDWYKFLEDKHLNQLIDVALKNSPNINIAKEKLRQSRYNLYMTNADFLPSFNIDGEYVKSNPPKVAEQTIKQDYFQIGLDAGWEIDIWGGNRRLSESARAMVASVSANFDNVKTVLISEIAATYVNWRLYQLLVSETKKNIANQKIVFENIKSKYEAGLVDALVYNQAESLLKSTQQQLPEFVSKEANNLNSLAVLTGKLPSEIQNNSNNLLNKKFVFDNNALYDLPVIIIRNRPDVIASEQELIAQNALVGNKISNLLPSLSLSSLLGYQNNTLSPIFAKDFNMYSNTIESIMPIFHWGKILNDIKKQESVTVEALNNYKLALLQALVDVLNATSSVSEGIKSYRLAEENLKLYQNIANLSDQKYTQGLIAFSDYLDAEQNRISALIKKHESLTNLLVQTIYFYKAIGGKTNTNYSKPGDQTDCSKTEHELCKG